MNIPALSAFVEATRKPEPAPPSELELDAATVVQCLGLIDQQICNIAFIVAKHGLDALTDALGSELSADAKAILESFGKDFEDKCAAMAVGIAKIAPIEEADLEKPISDAEVMDMRGFG